MELTKAVNTGTGNSLVPSWNYFGKRWPNSTPQYMVSLFHRAIMMSMNGQWFNISIHPIVVLLMGRYSLLAEYYDTRRSVVFKYIDAGWSKWASMNQFFIGSINGSSTHWRQAITWGNDEFSLVKSLETDFSAIIPIEIRKDTSNDM